MEWRPARLYGLMTISVCTLVISGVFIFLRHAQTPALTGVSSWGGTGTIFETSSAIPVTQETSAQSGEAATATTAHTLPYSYTTSTPQPGSVSTIATQNDDSSFDFEAFVRELSQKSTSTHTAQESSTTGFDSWSFIPSGIIAVATTTTRTAAQEALYAYGNAAGRYIKEYDETHTDQVQILTNQLQDRGSASKALALARVGEDLENVGDELDSIPSIPASAQGMNAALAASYRDAGKKLVALSQAGTLSDKDLITAINTYNAAASGLSTHFAAVIFLFSANDVSFASSDTGSVFSFNPQAL